MVVLALIFAGLAALGLGFLIHPQLSWRSRLALVVCIPVLAFAVWRAAQPPTGWPSSSKPPKDAAFVWGVVHEPDQLTHDKGEIDLWLIVSGKSQPRAYRLPYTRQLHQQVAQATAATKRGAHLRVSRRRASGKGQGQSPGRFVFYVEPPVRLPPKSSG